MKAKFLFIIIFLFSFVGFAQSLNYGNDIIYGTLQLKAYTPTTVPYLDSTSMIQSSAVTPTELGFVHGVTSSLCGINQSCTLTNKVMSGSSNTFSNIGYSSLVLTSSIVNADISSSAAIARSKIASGTASQVVTNDGSGNLTSVAVLPISQGGTNNGSLGVTAGGALATDGSKIVNIGAGSQGQVFTSNGTSTPSWQAAGGSGSGINILQPFNWNAELGATTNWSNSGGTFAVDNTPANVANGLWAFTFTASAISQTVTSTLATIPAGLYGQNCLLEFYQKGFDANMTVQVTDGTNILVSKVLTAASGYTLQDMNFICPSSGSLQMKLISTAASAQGWFDEVHLGSADNYAQISQAQLVGQIKFTGCSNWSTTATSFANFSATTGCTSTVLAGSGVTAPSTIIPGLTFASLPPGNYLMVWTGVMRQDTTSKGGYFRFSDGTNASDSIATVQNNSSLTIIGGFSSTINYTTSQSNVTLQVQGATDSGGTAELGTQTIGGSVISVYRFPTSSQLAVTPNLGPANWAATSTFFGSTTSTSYADPGSVTGAITIAGTPRNISCIANASGKLGIDCTLPKPGNYLVCYTGSATNTTTSDSTFSELTDGSGTVVVGEQRTMPGSGSNYTAIGSCGNYTAASTSVTFKVQLKVSAATGQVNNMSFSIAGLDQALPAPYYVGNVSSSTSGQERTERAAWTSICSTSPCTLSSFTPGIASVTRSSTGVYVANFVAGAFSAPPTCSVTSDGLTFNGATATTTTFQIGNLSGAIVAQDSTRMNILCMGPH